MDDILNIKGIKCDNESCDYKDSSATLEQYENYLNKPCPRCGSNLLTESDLKTVMMLVNIFNSSEMKELAQLTEELNPEGIDNDELVTGSIEMNGSGKINLKWDKE
jgi:hypothetical protein